MKHFRRVFSSFTKWMTVKEALNCKEVHHLEAEIKIQGWVTSMRKHKELVFIHLNDGSSSVDLQVIAPANILQKGKSPTYGSSVHVNGRLVESTHSQQLVELQLSTVQVIGECSSEYPFRARTKHTTDYVRQFLHLRPRTKQFSAVLRIRNNAIMAVHDFFQSKGFVQVHTPVLTSNDCEGAGELFQVFPAQDLDGSTTGKKKHFFDTPTYLTVSGQLNAEAMTSGMSKVYTFGPTFRAEKSHTRRHLSEFYMVEAETILLKENEGLNQIMELSEDLCKFVFHSLLTKSPEDLNLFHTQQDMKTRFTKCLDTPYKRITYEEAIELLQKSSEKHTFQYGPKLGVDLSGDHEQYLVHHYFQDQPVFVTDYPAALKPFYAKTRSNNGHTALAMDLLMPGIGEVIGGTVREDDYQTLKETLESVGKRKDYEWYLDLRRFGSVPHGGFGLGFERLLQVALGIKNIRDVIPFPRYLGSCQM